MSTPKDWQDYQTLAEWIVIKVGNQINADKASVRFVASCLADEYNHAWDDSLITHAKTRFKPNT